MMAADVLNGEIPSALEASKIPTIQQHKKTTTTTKKATKKENKRGLLLKLKLFIVVVLSRIRSVPSATKKFEYKVGVLLIPGTIIIIVI